jgi:hypothetical protein
MGGCPLEVQRLPQPRIGVVDGKGENLLLGKENNS